MPLFVLGIIGAVVGPPWLVLLAMGLLAFRYRAPEVLALGLLVDLLWQPAGQLLLPLFTIAGLVLVWGLEPLRNEFLLPESRT